MTKDKLAKALLGDHICATCIGSFFKTECPHKQTPKNNTCERWNKPGHESAMIMELLEKEKMKKAREEAWRQAMMEDQVLDD